MEIPDTTLAYVWQVPEKPVSVSLSLDILGLIGVSALEGGGPVDGRGIETGGLLLGRTRKIATGKLVEIDAFEPVESEHAVGPSYLLSEHDRNRLKERIAAHRSKGRLSVVGFYR